MQIFFLFFIALWAPLFSEEKKIIFLISTPRSLSTGFLRMMEARGDFEIFHEPTNAPYDAIYYKDFYKENFKEDCFHSYEEIMESIFANRKHSHVFVKEVAFCCHELLTSDNPLFQSAHFAFLIRKPQDVILSLYRRGAPLDVIGNLAGFQQMYELFELAVKYANYPPYMFFSEDLGENPSDTVASFCQHMEIPFKPESLTWDDLGSQFTGREWRDGKKIACLQHWQGDAIRSTCFVPLRTAEVDGEGIPTFAEVENLEARAICRVAYFDNLSYYLTLKKKWETLTEKNSRFLCYPYHDIKK